MKTIKYPSFWGEETDVAFVIEQENPLKLSLFCKDEEYDFWEPFCNISTSAPGLYATSDTCYVKNWAENKGLDKWLVDNGFAQYTGDIQYFVYVAAPEMKFDLDKIREYELKEDAA